MMDFNMYEKEIFENDIIVYQNFCIPMAEVIKRYKNEIKKCKEIEVLPFIYLKTENKFCNKKFIMKCKNSIDSFYIIGGNKTSGEIQKNSNKKIDYISDEMGWVNVDDISYSTYLHCDIIDIFKRAGFVINCDANEYAPFSEYQIWEMTKNNKQLFEEVCMKCHPCESKVSNRCGTYDLDEKHLYAKNVFCETNKLSPGTEILVDNMNGGLVMVEGKHRICLCKKLNYSKMLVKIINKGCKEEQPNTHVYKKPKLTNLYNKTIKWDSLCTRFYSFYLEKLKMSKEALETLYCGTVLKDYVDKIEEILNKEIIEIIKL